MGSYPPAPLFNLNEFRLSMWLSKVSRSLTSLSSSPYLTIDLYLRNKYEKCGYKASNFDSKKIIESMLRINTSMKTANEPPCKYKKHEKNGWNVLKIISIVIPIVINEPTDLFRSAICDCNK